MTIKVKAIIGSTSSTSFNLKIVEHLRKRYADQLHITPVFINDLENFSIDTENNPPANVQDFKNSVKPELFIPVQSTIHLTKILHYLNPFKVSITAPLLKRYYSPIKRKK